MTQTLPTQTDQFFVTDGGLETTLVFEHGFDLPAFAAFPLLRTDEGRQTLRDYYLDYAEIARRHGLGLVMETPTWRASRAWAEATGTPPEALAQINRDSVAFLDDLRREIDVSPVVVSGCVGPRGDGYDPGESPDAPEAEAYHTEQIHALASGGADLITAFTIPAAPEAVGIARAASGEGVPSVIGFTVETDGRLPSGETLESAVAAVDAEAPPLYFMINCAHPTHFAHVLDGAPWTQRIRALRANASTRSHAELDESDTLDAGDPADLGARHVALARALPLAVIGGCCGTDTRHVGAMCEAVLAA